MGNTSGNHTALGFGHDSLNSLNSGKVIKGKLHWPSETIAWLVMNFHLYHRYSNKLFVITL